MVLRVVHEVDGRSADRVTATPDGWATAHAHAVTCWRGRAAPEPGVPVMSDQAVPGPLRWLAPLPFLAWGPVPLPGEQPRWTIADLTAVALEDVGEGAARIFDLAIGALAPDAQLAYLSYRLKRSRARGAERPAADPVRSAVVDMGQRRVGVTVPGPIPTAVDWSSGPLVLGHAGRIVTQSGDGAREDAWLEQPLGDPSAVRALVAKHGFIVAGMASGNLIQLAPDGSRSTWSAHRGPVTALSAGSDSEVLLSGGADGFVRMWADATAGAPRTLLGELELRHAVDALAGPVDSSVAALAGGAFLVLHIA